MKGLRRAMAGLLGRLLFRPSGEDLLRSLEAELHRAPSFDEGWRRLCETAWALGFVDVRIAPVTRLATSLPARHASVPGGGGAVSTWAFDVVLGRGRVATVTARLGANSLRFDPTRLVAAVQVLVRRFLEPA
jgi:hypothetical protein